MTLTNHQREEVLGRIENYAPLGTDAGTWEHIAHFVRETAKKATVGSETGSKVFVADQKSSVDVRGVLRVLTRACARAFNSGRALTVDTVLSDANVSAILATLKSRNSVSQEAYLYRLVREALDGQELSLYHRRDIEKPPAQPYKPNDWQRLHHWVVSQSTELRRERAAVIVGLGLGAGIGPEVARVKARDVTLDPDGVVWVAVPHRVAEGAAPAVPVAAALARNVWEVAQKREPDELLLGGAESDVREITKRLNLNRSFRVELDRLRATWVREVVRNLPRETAAAAVGTDLLSFRRLEKTARLDPATPDSLADRLDVLADPLRDWPALRLSEAAPVADVGEGTGSVPVSDAVVVSLPKPEADSATRGDGTRAAAPEPGQQATVADLDAHRPQRAPRSISSELPAPEEGRLTDFARGPNPGTESRGW